MNQSILQQIHRCIQTPQYCNTNLIPVKARLKAAKKAAALETAPVTTTTTTTTTTTPKPLLTPADFARRCVETGKCADFSGGGGVQAEPVVVDRRPAPTLDQQVRLCLFQGICKRRR